MSAIDRIERTILLMLSYGRSHRQVAKRLKISLDAVETSVNAAVRKLRAKTDYHAIAKAFVATLGAVTISKNPVSEAQAFLAQRNQDR